MMVVGGINKSACFINTHEVTHNPVDFDLHPPYEKEEDLWDRNVPLIFVDRYKVIGMVDTPAPRDHTHPDWKKTECHIYNENNALLEALKQAQVLTKTVTIEDTLPEAIEDAARIPQTDEVHSQVKKAILMANVFDCEQVKLPKIKDPLRPAYNFTRILGIGDIRKKLV